MNPNLEPLISTLEEVMTMDDLRAFFDSGKPLRHYIGFEISGQVHLGTGLMTMRVIKELQKLGVETNIWLADWHSVINHKLGGDPKVIRELAISYFKEAMIASALCVGVDVDKLYFKLANDYYDNDFWMTTVEVAKNVTLNRAKRSVDITGREAGEDMKTALLFYPMMQVADIYHLGIHLAHAGSDQRKAHVVARDVASDITFKPLMLGEKRVVPIGFHHHLLSGLLKPPVWPIPADKKREVLTSMKMSKSKPDSAIFLTDTPSEIERKIMGAFCPPCECEGNPVIDWVENIVLPLKGELVIERPEKWGGRLVIDTVEKLRDSYTCDQLHPQDLKMALAKSITEILEPARKHFVNADRLAALEKIKKLTSR